MTIFYGLEMGVNPNHLLPSPKLTANAPLKIGRNPKGKRKRLPVPSIFRRQTAVSFREGNWDSGAFSRS